MLLLPGGVLATRKHGSKPSEEESSCLAHSWRAQHQSRLPGSGMNWIDGAWIDSAKRTKSFDRATGEEIGTLRMTAMLMTKPQYRRPYGLSPGATGKTIVTFAPRLCMQGVGIDYGLEEQAKQEKSGLLHHSAGPQRIDSRQ